MILLADVKRDISQDIWIDKKKNIQEEKHFWYTEEISDDILEDLNHKARNQNNLALYNEIKRVKTIVLNQVTTHFREDNWNYAIFLLKKIAYFLWNTANKISINNNYQSMDGKLGKSNNKTKRYVT